VSLGYTQTIFPKIFQKAWTFPNIYVIIPLDFFDEMCYNTLDRRGNYAYFY